MDVPIIDPYVNPRNQDWIFAGNDAARYGFIEAAWNSGQSRHMLQSMIFVVMYLTNDVIKIKTR